MSNIIQEDIIFHPKQVDTVDQVLRNIIFWQHYKASQFEIHYQYNLR